VVLDLVKFMFNMFLEGREGREGVPTSAVTLFQGQWHGFQRLGVSPLKPDISGSRWECPSQCRAPGVLLICYSSFVFLQQRRNPTRTVLYEVLQ
jgi:hypothetical protein